MLDLPASTLRGWHRRYQIPVGDTPSGRHRRYTAADIDALLRMKHLISQGMSINAAVLLAFRQTEADANIDDLLAAVSRLDTETAVSLLDARITAHGVVDAWQTLCRPALSILDGSESTEVDHCIDLVHALSWTITAALNRVAAPRSAETRVLLACVEGERHTLALEALRAALAQEGVAANLLGASLPQTALKDALHRTETPPAALVLWAQRPTDPRGHAITTPATHLLLVGPGWPAATTPARSLPEAISLLTRHRPGTRDISRA